MHPLFSPWWRTFWSLYVPGIIAVLVLFSFDSKHKLLFVSHPKVRVPLRARVHMAVFLWQNGAGSVLGSTSCQHFIKKALRWGAFVCFVLFLWQQYLPFNRCLGWARFKPLLSIIYFSVRHLFHIFSSSWAANGGRLMSLSHLILTVQGEVGVYACAIFRRSPKPGLFQAVLKGNSSIFKPRPYFWHGIRSSTHREQFGESRRPSEDI